MPTCKKYVTDDVIVIGREKTFARSARQTDKHCAPRETIPGLLLNQFIAFQSKFLQTILTSLQLYHSHLFFHRGILSVGTSHQRDSPKYHIKLKTTFIFNLILSCNLWLYLVNSSQNA